MNMRVAIFVDGANMFYAQREIGWHIDFKKIYQYYTDNRQIYGAFYFTATPPAGDQQRVEKYRKFRGALINMGFTVIDKEVKIIKDDKTGQVKLKGNLDIELVFRMITGANGYDEAILMGGDSDYVPIITHLRNLGKEVVCIGRRASTSLELINAATRFVDLDNIKSRIIK
jgi:uncharacterized LabA/DUF88 family protein